MDERRIKSEGKKEIKEGKNKFRRRKENRMCPQIFTFSTNRTLE